MTSGRPDSNRCSLIEPVHLGYSGAQAGTDGKASQGRRHRAWGFNAR